MDKTEGSPLQSSAAAAGRVAGALDASLQEMAATATIMLASENCSIMLADVDSGVEPTLTVRACVGPLPAEAYRETPGKAQGIAGHVLATGLALCVDDIAQSAFAACARRPADPRRSLMCAPIRLRAQPIGVINVSGRQGGGPFGPNDLKLLEAVALIAGKTIEVAQLQSMLESRFAQMAILQEAAQGATLSLAAGLPNPDQVARIMAKSFYREMTRAGFGSRQIINAASEIIAQLSGNLQRHSRRLGLDGQVLESVVGQTGPDEEGGFDRQTPGTR